MTVRVVVGTLLLALVGVVGGFVVGDLRDTAPVTIASATPVPAEAPSVPAGLPDVFPDPATTALQPSQPTAEETLGGAFGVRVPIPDGWLKTQRSTTEWVFTVPGAPLNTYLLRVKLVGDLHLSVSQALEQRMSALADAVDDFDVEKQTDDTFVATYIAENHRRLAMERYLSLDGSDAAFVTIAVIGRLADRDGLADLLERTTQGATRVG